MNKIEQQELNDCQSRNRRAETNKTSYKCQLILPCPGKQGKNLITKMKKHIRKTLPETYRR